jgi:AbiV family abortive infection protein
MEPQMSKNKRLPQYKGVLTSKQIAEGMNAATHNATRLAEDADIMLNLDRFPSAVALAILAIEESGKLTILREMALVRNGDAVAETWRAYRQHTSKNQMWILIDSALKGSSKLQDFGHLFDPDSDHPQILDQLKQVSFYTDCLNGRHWSIPEDVIDADLAKMLVAVAKTLSQNHVITVEEVDLWIQHMQPVYKTTTQAMERALVAWDKEMRARGLLSDGSTTMEEFVKNGINIRQRVSMADSEKT